MKVLAGDIGGTSSRLAIFEATQAGATSLAEHRYGSHDYPGLDAIVAAFTAEYPLPFDHACFGIAGPIRAGRATLPNVPWTTIDAHALARQLKLDRVWLINDLEANAYGIAYLGHDDFAVINEGIPAAQGNAAVISAGTGLGEAGLAWNGHGHLPFATEGGHADFAPQDEVQIGLLRHLQLRFDHVSCERIVSGPGIANIYKFLRDSDHAAEQPAIAARIAKEDPAAVIAGAALDGSCELCVAALDVFVRAYGAEAGNLALKTLATHGVFIGGGIAPKILPALTSGAFIEAFFAKGRMRPLMQAMPVSVILNPATALLGAARCGMLRTGTSSQEQE